MSGLTLEQRAKNLERALAWIYSDTNIKGDKPTGIAQLRYRKLYEKVKSAGGVEKAPWTSGPKGPLAELETRIMNSYTQAKHSAGLTTAERKAVTKTKVAYDAANPKQRHASAKKTQILGSLKRNILKNLKSLGLEEDLRVAKGLKTILSKRGRVATEADIELHQQLLKTIKDSKAEIRHLEAARKGERVGTYNLTKEEIKQLPELYEFEKQKKAFNAKLHRLRREGVINEAQYKKYRLAGGHILNFNSFPEFASQLSNIRAELYSSNIKSGIKLTPAQIWDAAKRSLNNGGLGIDLKTRNTLNEFGRWAEKNNVDLGRGLRNFRKEYTAKNSLGYLTGFDADGYGLRGVKRRPVTEAQEVIPPRQINQFDEPDLAQKTRTRQREIYNKSIINLWKSNPKKAAIATALLPASLLYSTVSSSDDVPIESLDRPRGERFLGTRRADNVWQSAKHNVLKEGGWLDWFSLLDYTDLGFYGKGQRKYNMNLKNAEERKMVDPTWRGTGLLETQGDKITTLDRQRRKRENIWT